MKSPKAAPPRKPHSYAQYMTVQDLRTRIQNGHFPTTHEVKLSGTFLVDDFVADVSGFATEVLFTVRATDFDALKKLSEGTVTIDLLRAARDVCTHADDKNRIHMYLCAMGDHAAVLAECMEVIGMDFASSANFRDAVYRLTFVLGCIGLGVGRHHPLGDIDAIVAIGQERLGEIYRIAGEHRDCVTYASGLRDDDPVDPKDELYAALRGAAAGVVAEDRAEIDAAFLPVESEVVLETREVLGFIDRTTLTQAKKDQTKGIIRISGKALPLPAVPDVMGDWMGEFSADYPHLFEVTRRMATQLATMKSVAGVRWLFVGPPGVGKTDFARVVFDSLQVPSLLFACGGASDGTFAGTSAQWNSGRPSIPLHACALHGVAAPGIILDELDKIGSSRHNGNLGDALLSFLEPSSSRRIMDPLTETEVDLSGVNYIATANSLGDVPPPLRDRFKVFQVPAFEWKHVGSLTSSIIKRIAEERGLQPGFLPPLAPDELELIKRSGPVGSLRRLRQAVETMIDVREQMQVRN